MNLEQAIHQRWAADSDLTTVLPAENVVTGRRGSRQVPYATLHRKQCRNLLRTNDGDVDEATVLIHVWHDDYDAGRAIVERVTAAFDGSDFTLADDQRVVRMRRTADSTREHDDGLWLFSLEFLAYVYLPSGN